MDSCTAAVSKPVLPARLKRRPRPEEDLPAGLEPLESLFENPAAPLEVEIGCGKGKFLSNRSTVCPEINFLGIDYAGKWMKIGQKRGEKRQIRNLKFLKVHARPILTHYLPAGKVSVFHVYFPDPWPKRRHQKRRVISQEILGLMRSRLVPGGKIEIATDFADYFKSIQELVRETAVWWGGVKESVNQRLFCPDMKTSYELKYEAEGRPLYYMELSL